MYRLAWYYIVQYMLKYITMFLALITLAVVGYFFYQGKVSQKQGFRHTTAAKLSACPNTPNCVCSEYPEDAEHYISALGLDGLDLATITSAIKEIGGTIVVQDDAYISAEFKSGLFGFVDDFEVRVDEQNNQIHLRSASRVGRSDLGANRNRVEKFKQVLSQG